MLSFQAFPYEGKELRTVIVNGEPWFVGADACRILEFGNPNQVMSRLRADERVTLRKVEGCIDDGITGKISSNAILINESGLYRLIMRSNKPQAKVFQDWVLHDVLPALGKTGHYDMSETSDDSSKSLSSSSVCNVAGVERKTCILTTDKGIRLEVPADTMGYEALVRIVHELSLMGQIAQIQ